MKKLLFLSFALLLLISVSFVGSSCVNKEAQERQRSITDSIAKLDSINNIGDWTIQYYVDDFGESTDKGYIYLQAYGTFSNSATTNSPLKVEFVIDSSTIRMNIHEYAGNHPIKGEGTLKFRVKDSDGETFDIETYNDDYGINSIRGISDDETLRKILYKGGQIKFAGVSDKYGSPSEYWFTIENADHLEKALSKIDKKK